MALCEQRCRSAAQSFTELLNGLEPQKIQVRCQQRAQGFGCTV